ncbi:protein rhomboid [Condylostylus longicornis]|uniref:protein rhomboid n=1 Tax=Condylostylus longicornis TaxID=2530218 RepID=UPI00244DF74D|nr:protein rhomboid [Condylostylus longicornis]
MSNNNNSLYPQLKMAGLQENTTTNGMERGDNGHPQEEIPLQRLTSEEQRAAETAERQKVYELFKKYDTNNDDRLNLKELKVMIKGGLCRQMSRGLSHHLIHMNDRNGDRHLDFEEFYELTQNNKWLISSVMNEYCRLLVPLPNREIGDQIDGAYERQMTFCPPPLTMVIFSLIEVIFFLIDVIYFKDDPNNTKKVGENTNGPAAKLFIYNPYRRYEAWRFVTYMFVHVGIMHLFMNLLIQILLGVALELVHHWWRITLIYLAGVLAGSMGTSLTSPTIYLAGASGGVYALITAHIATIILNWKEMEFAIIQLCVFLIFCLTDLGTSIYRHMTDQNDQVGYVAHLCGALAGLLVGIGVLRNLKEQKWERILWWVAILVFFALLSAGILIHIFDPSHFPRQDYFPRNTSWESIRSNKL